MISKNVYRKALMVLLAVIGMAPCLHAQKSSEIGTEMVIGLTGSPGSYGTAVEARPGDEIAYRVSLANTGQTAGVRPRITLTLDPRLTYIPGSSTIRYKERNRNYDAELLERLIKFQGRTITWGFTNMAPRPEASLYLTFRVSVGAAENFPVGATLIRSFAQATFNGAAARTNATTLSVTRHVRPDAPFILRQEFTNLTLGGPAWYSDKLLSAAPGDVIAYRTTLINAGNVTAKNIVLKDLLPDGLIFSGIKVYNDKAKDGFVVPGNDILRKGYVFPRFPSGNSHYQHIVLTATVARDAAPSDAGESRTLTNRTQLIDSAGVLSDAEGSVRISATRGLIVVAELRDPVDNEFKERIGLVRSGQIVTCRVSVQNNGTREIADPTLRIALAPQSSYVSGSLTFDRHVFGRPPMTKFLTTETLNVCMDTARRCPLARLHPRP